MKHPLLGAGFLVVGFGLLGGSFGPAAAAPVRVDPSLKQAVKGIDVAVDPVKAARGQTVTWRLTIEVENGWHTYPAEQTEPEAKDFVNQFTFPKPGDIVFVGKTEARADRLNVDPLKAVELEGKVVFERPFVLSPSATPGDKDETVTLKFTVCDASRCLPPKTIRLPLHITVTDAKVAVDPKYAPEVEGKPPAKDPDKEDRPPSPTQTPAHADASTGPAPPSAGGGSPGDHRASLEAVMAQLDLTGARPAPTGLGSFLLQGVFWGAVSLITPCVFPMIPITVSFFLKQSEKAHHRPVMMAVVYCLTIVAVLTVAAVMLLSFFRWLSTVFWVMNLVLGILFVLFALSLFGMYDIELPSGLARLTSAREGRGGLASTVFMALTFTIVSFACVAPFLGGFGGTAAGSNLGIGERLLGGLAFSLTFASPFFILALFPTLLKRVPKSGSWLNSVKVVMGFLELAAALNFFRAAELVWRGGHATLFTYDFVLGLCIALSFLCGLYLLGVYRLPYDTPAEHLGVMRLLLSFFFLGIAFYMLPGLFRVGAAGERQRPAGSVYAWFESFLLPEPGASDSLAWTGDLKQAVDDARAQRRQTGRPDFIFVDFTGVTCKNCKLNERDVFPKKAIQDLFKKYRLVQLFTDTVPPELYPLTAQARLGETRQKQDAEANLWFQRRAFGTEQLPLYVILEPLADRIKVVGVYAEGKINDEAAFADFLKRPFASAMATVGGQAVASR